MKKLFAAFALAGLALSCKSTADVSATAAPCEPGCEKACCAKECEGEMKDCEGKTDCSTEGAVCPVTGKSIN